MNVVELIPDMRLVIILTGAMTIIALIAMIVQAFRQASSKLVFQAGEINREMASLEVWIKDTELRVQSLPEEIANERREADKAAQRIVALEEELAGSGQNVRFSAMPIDHVPREGETLHAYLVTNEALAQAAIGTSIGEFVRRGHRCLCYGTSQNVAMARMLAKYPASAGFVVAHQGKA